MYVGCEELQSDSKNDEKSWINFEVGMTTIILIAGLVILIIKFGCLNFICFCINVIFLSINIFHLFCELLYIFYHII